MAMYIELSNSGGVLLTEPIGDKETPTDTMKRILREGTILDVGDTIRIVEDD